jgi:hypothetical protein
VGQVDETAGGRPAGDATIAHTPPSASAAEHPTRVALLDLLRRHGTVTSTDAARELGGNTGLHSFHLRQLARQGLVEPAPAVDGRSRPWRLVTAPAPEADAGAGDLGALNRGLEDEAFLRWLGRRDDAPRQWRRDEAFSQVIYLTPDELTALAGAIRGLLAGYRDREAGAAARPAGAAPVAVIARLFPLLDVEP